jgi:predicted nuclease of predicted toxin-antitoxin system
MRLLLDQGLPRSTARLLAERGIDAVHVADLGLATATDEDILARAGADRRIVVTLDADFHALLALSDAAGPSVVRIRREGLRGDAMAELLSRVVALVSGPLTAGAMVTVTDRGVRIHHLPVSRALAPGQQDDADRWQSGSTDTTAIGYVNKNGQSNLGTRGVAGTDHGQLAYRLRCGHCGHEYGANGTDIFQRKCPQCQRGLPGIRY